MRDGKLPQLARLAEIGTSGQLMSTLPPYTGTAWVSFATGKGPGKHGIVDFWQQDSHGGRSLIDARAVRAEYIWHYLSRLDRKVGVVNVPLTYPPQPVNGVLISGMMTPNESVEYTYPAALKGELLQTVGKYAADPYVLITQDVDFLKQVIYWEQQRERANQYLLAQHDFDFFINIVQGPDPIQHHFWRHLDPTHPLHDPREAATYGPWLLQCYQAVDEVVGHRLSLLDERTLLLVISDHGFGPIHKYFNVNRFLAEQGFLVFHEESIPNQFGRATMRTARVALRNLDILNLRTRLLDNRRRERLRLWLDRAGASPINWERSRAYYGGVTSQAIHINLRGREPHGIVEPGAAYESLRTEIINALIDLRDPDNDERVIESVHRREEIYQGPLIDELPDILFSMRGRTYSPVEDLTPKVIITDLPPQSGGGGHQPEGIILAAGAGIKQNARIEGAKLVDIVPTALYFLGLPIPEDMDGRVLWELFEPDHITQHSLSYGPATEARPDADTGLTEVESAAIEARLRQLGYLD